MPRQVKWLCLLFFVCCSLFLSACKTSGQVDAALDDSVKIYSVLPEDLTLALLNEYQLKTKTKINYKLIDKAQAFAADAEQPDLYIASRETLIALAAENKLQVSSLNAQDFLPVGLRDERGFWTGICYDPYVFLVNYSYSRKVGQKALLTWEDIAKQENIVISMEDLSSSQEMRYFLAAFASRQGEETTFRFLKNIHMRIPQYAKFAISPIRLTTIGEADLAITSRNKVIKYLENDFPAYIMEPQDGSPAQVFAAGVSKTSQKREACEKLISWMMGSDDVIIVTEKLGYGYLFLSPDFIDNRGSIKDLLWLNDKYLANEKQNALVDKWLQNVRFADK